MKKKHLIILGGVVAFAIVLVLPLTQVHPVRSGESTPTPTPAGWPDFPNVVTPPRNPTVVPPKVTDLSPNAASVDKIGILVRHADGSEEEFLLTADMADEFIKNLPKDDKLEAVVPPQSLMRHLPPTPEP